MDVIDRVPGLGQRAATLRQHVSDERLRHRAYTTSRRRCASRTGVAASLSAGRRRTAPRVTDQTQVRILVVNAGSSSMKLRLLGSADELARAADLGRRGGT
jgi:hypothetical protein